MRHGLKFDHVDIRLGGHLVFSVNKHNCLQELWYFILTTASVLIWKTAVFVVVRVGGDHFYTTNILD